MRIEVNEKYNFVLKEIYNAVIFETSEGNQFVICMRGDTVEMKIIGFDKWYKANMRTGEIEKIKQKKVKMRKWKVFTKDFECITKPILDTYIAKSKSQARYGHYKKHYSHIPFRYYLMHFDPDVEEIGR